MATPLATAFVRVRPDTSTFRREAETGVARANLGAAGKQHGRRFGVAFSAAAGAAMGVIGLKAIQLLGKTIIDARNLGMVPLQQAAKNAGIEWDKFAGRVQTADKTMERLGFTNAEVHASLTRLLTITRNQGLSLRTLSTAADLARFKHISLTQAAVLLGRAAAGNTRALKDVGIATNQLPKNFSTTGTAASRLNVVLGLMNKRIGGQAAAYTTTFGGKLDILKAKLTDTSARIGVALLPVLSKLADMATRYLVPALQRFSTWMTSTGVPALQKFAAYIGPRVTNLVVTFAAGISAIIRWVSGLPGPLKIAGAAIIALGVAMRLAAAANPWLLLASAIVLVIGIIVRNWNKIKAFTARVWAAILGAVRAVWDWIKRNWPLLASILTGPIGAAVIWIIRHWNTVTAAFRAAIGALRNAFAAFVGFILGIFGRIIHGAAVAFGWIPGLGGKLRTADRQFQAWAASVTRAIRGIPSVKTITLRAAGGGKITVSSSVKNAAGYLEFHRKGYLIPGYGGGDTYGPIMAERGEAIIPKDAARDPGFRAWARTRNIPGFAAGGLVGRFAGLLGRAGDREGIFGADRERAFGQAARDALMAGLRRAAAAVIGAVGTIGGGAGRWRGTALRALALLGQPAGAAGAVLQRIAMESGGNPYAVNKWDSNWQRGTPSVGLMQVIGPTFRAWAGRFRNTGPFLYGTSVNPLANIYAGLNYGIHRYGGLGFLTRPGGYARGGVITEPILGVGRSGRGYSFGERGPETVVPGVPSTVALEARLDRLIAAVERIAPATAAGVARAVAGPPHLAAASARLGAR